MDDQDRTLEIVALIYDAAVDPGVWPEALRRLSELLHSSAATLLYGDATSAAATIFESIGIDPQSLARYNEYYGHLDERLTIALERPGTIATNRRTGAHLYRGEFYNDFLAPADLPYVIGSVLLKEQRAFSTLGIHRSRRRGDFSEREERLYSVFVPHLRRAFAVHRRLHQARIQTSAGADALDCVALGVILLDGHGDVLLVNRSAQEILDQKDGLTLHRDGLHAASPELSKALRSLIRDAAGRDPASPRTGGAIALPRPSLQRPLSVLIAPLRLLPGLSLQADSVVTVFVSDPERGAETRPELLQRLYGLTVAESRLAALLLEGKTVEEAAGALEIAPVTARTQLKIVFRKTEVNRQSDLIRLLMSGLGQLRRT